VSGDDGQAPEAGRPGVYVETSVISYLTADPSRDFRLRAHQQFTKEWWDLRRGEFRLFVSALVRREAGAGDPAMVARRSEVLRLMEVVRITDEAQEFAASLVRENLVPAKAAADALHIATAAVYEIDYLLTWNCKHIANARVRPRIENACRRAGYRPPVLCTPEELL